ncbi:SRPBCC family protein [Nocardioides panacisoli]|uniref:SRPBCC family protein n=1 Tax=Nocardioides panacisoli TaxID=627624 RepID=A0ABP7ISD7_9ACTN
MFDRIAPTSAETAAAMPGDDVVPHADVTMDRAFTLEAAPEQVWPWLAQLGKWRAGWYLPSSVERLVPRSRRGLRHLDERFQELAVGDVIPDYGGRDATFEVVQIDPPHALVYRSVRGRMHVSWAITLEAVGPATRIRLRLRLGPVKRTWLAGTGGELFDALTIAGLAAGLAERVPPAPRVGRS